MVVKEISKVKRHQKPDLGRPLGEESGKWLGGRSFLGESSLLASVPSFMPITSLYPHNNLRGWGLSLPIL